MNPQVDIKTASEENNDRKRVAEEAVYAAAELAAEEGLRLHPHIASAVAKLGLSGMSIGLPAEVEQALALGRKALNAQRAQAAAATPPVPDWVDSVRPGKVRDVLYAWFRGELSSKYQIHSRFKRPLAALRDDIHRWKNEDGDTNGRQKALAEIKKNSGYSSC